MYLPVLLEKILDEYTGLQNVHTENITLSYLNKYKLLLNSKCVPHIFIKITG